MIRKGSLNTRKGFTLIELMAVVVIISILTFMAINLFNSVKARDQHHDSRQRMDLIIAKIRQYYQSQEQLPPPDDNNKLPAEDLGMEQKYRLDAWGQYFEYHSAADNGCINDDEDMEGPFVLEVDGRPADGVLISLGHNQKRDYVSDNTETPCTFTTGGDDVLRGLDLTAEKTGIALRKLKVLQEKISAYDALFAGVDNNGDGVVDNVADVGNPAIIEVDVGNTCPPTHSFTNDPPEGPATLSEIEKLSENEDVEDDYIYADCLQSSPDDLPLPVVFHIVDFYGLPSGRSENSDECDPNRTGGYDCDPWNRPFKWGYEGRILDDNETEITVYPLDSSLDPPPPPSNRWYHRFYSSGPNETIIEDDIIFTGP